MAETYVITPTLTTFTRGLKFISAQVNLQWLSLVQVNCISWYKQLVQQVSRGNERERGGAVDQDPQKESDLRP